MNTARIMSLCAAVLATAAFGQTPDSSNGVVVPTVPAPATMPVPNKIIYASRLPTVNELSAAAAAQQLTIVRIEQTAAKVTAVYQSANGATTTVTYQLLSSAGDTGVAVVAPSSPPPAVVYQPAPRVVYYDGYGPYTYGPYYYDPYYWYPPVSVRLGFGFRGGFRR